MNKLLIGSALVAVSVGVLAAGAWGLKEPPADKPARPETPAATKPADKPAEKTQKSEGKESAYVLGYKMKAIDGKDADLATYKGKVVLIVNVASQCGLTKQYEGLQKLYDAKKEKGLVILGFPANNFGGQEPGTNEEISQFCSRKFKVTFPMFAKISVKGEDCHPLYKQLAARAGGEPSWNFTKYLVDRQGNVVERFDPRMRPDDPELEKKIDALLDAKPKA
ncbi:MAG: glutathione peroxidase [Phycisphaerales bacterium]